MPSGVQDSSNSDGGWTNTAITSFMPAGAVAEIQRAFAAWSQVTNIRFVEVPDSGAAFGEASGGDIRIGGHAMDGGSGTLAHGFYPPPNLGGAAGDLHFEIAENWRVRSLDGDPNTIDIFTIAAHEIGHAIGLGHEPKELALALMNPIYNEAINGLQPDDIRGAQALYGQLGTTPAVPNMLGQWWMSGFYSAGISDDGGHLTFTNERGERSNGGFTAANRVIANDWGNLAGDIVSTANGYEIRWTNGTFWSQQQYTQPSIGGQWWMPAAC